MAGSDVMGQAKTEVRVMGQVWARGWPASMPGFEPLDLDGMSVAVKDYDALAAVYQLYGAYCTQRARAMRLQQAGEGEAARRVGDLMMRLYQQLPEWAQWERR